MKSPTDPASEKKLDNPEQSRRFEEKARELGADESGKSFERALRAISKKPAQHKPKNKDR
jgi:hypothetical protein